MDAISAVVYVQEPIEGNVPQDGRELSTLRGSPCERALLGARPKCSAARTGLQVGEYKKILSVPGTALSLVAVMIQ